MRGHQTRVVGTYKSEKCCLMAHLYARQSMLIPKKMQYDFYLFFGLTSRERAVSVFVMDFIHLQS
jgi:hypothetical protein